MTPDKEPVAETLEEIADRIAYKYLDRTFGSAKLKSDILKALRNRDERAAKFADAEAQRATQDEALSNDDADRGRCHAAMSIAKAIREGK